MSLRDVIRSITDEVWQIGIIDAERCDGIRWVGCEYKGVWWADPFILDVTDDEIVVLAEEWVGKVRKGRIVELRIDRDSLEVKKRKVLLEKATHLSFPFVWRDGENIWIMPENGEEGGLWKYKYNEGGLTDGVKVADEAIEDGVVWNGKLYGTLLENPNGKELWRFEWNGEKFVKEQKFVFDENIARMAGAFFEKDGKWYRPAQECNTQYGHAVVIQEVTGEGFEEVERIYSEHQKLRVGRHTWNEYKGVWVTDALGFERMWIRKIIGKQ